MKPGLQFYGLGCGSMAWLDGTARWHGSMARLDGTARWHGSRAWLGGTARRHGSVARLGGTARRHGSVARLDGTARRHGSTARLDGTARVLRQGIINDACDRLHEGFSNRDEAEAVCNEYRRLAQVYVEPGCLHISMQMQQTDGAPKRAEQGFYGPMMRALKRTGLNFSKEAQKVEEMRELRLIVRRAVGIGLVCPTCIAKFCVALVGVLYVLRCALCRVTVSTQGIFLPCMRTTFGALLSHSKRQLLLEQQPVQLEMA